MSLIEEALRRAQDPTIPQTPQPTPTATPQAKPQRNNAHSWSLKRLTPHAPTLTIHPLMVVAAAILSLTVVLIVGGAFWMGRVFRGGPAAVTMTGATMAGAMSAVAPPPPAIMLSEPSEKTATAQPPLVLSGVVAGNGDSYAVINGNIVAVGEEVGGSRLVEITEGAVKLRDAAGNDTELRVPR